MIKNNKESKKNKTPETTGHEWDGLQEYNTPTPRWWLIVWVITIIWSIIFWFFYPAWPTISGNTKGLKNWTQQTQLKEQQDEILARKNVYLDKFNKSSFLQIKNNPQLLEFAITGGEIAFKENCAACHGTGAAGSKGFPNLNDDDWLWGGRIEDIYQTLLYGIRSNHPKARQSDMPRFGLDEILTKEEIENVAEYVLSISNNGKFNKNGKKTFMEQCAVCHKANARGDRSIGAPNLSDSIWLYGNSKKDIIHTITNSKAGVMPNWNERLDDATIRQLSIYVHSLGGGE